LPFAAFIEHDDDRANDLQMAQLFRGDVEKQILTTWILLGQRLSEIAGRGGEFALGTTELLKEQVGKARIRLGNTDGVLQSFVVQKHGGTPISS
nr:hypothetical protein [Tanacetum cinerariifolium]